MGFNPDLLLIVMAAFFVAGFTKGVVGLGLPPLVLGIVTASIGINSAMAVVALPALVTNLAQAVYGDQLKPILKRHSMFLFAATASVFLGSWMSTFVGSEVPSLILAGVLLSYSLLGLMRLPIKVRKDHGRVLSIGMGTCNGILTGVTGSSAVPGVFYLQSICQCRDMLIQAMGILFSLSAIALTVTLSWRGFLTFEIGLLSVLSLCPALAGMALGIAVRKRMPTSIFLHSFYFALLALGCYIFYSNLIGFV